MVIPSPRGEWFCERLGRHTVVTRRAAGRPFHVVVEQTRADCIHPCTVDDIARMLSLVPARDLDKLELVLLRQPKRKEQILSPVWGRLRYAADIAKFQGPVIILEAVAASGVALNWSRKLDPGDQEELERLRADADRVEESKRGYRLHFSVDAVRYLQLFRTFPHELGHWVHYLDRVERPSALAPDRWDTLQEAYKAIPKQEREAFAHRYSDHTKQALEAMGHVPFPRILDARSLGRDGLRRGDFDATAKKAVPEAE